VLFLFFRSAALWAGLLAILEIFPMKHTPGFLAIVKDAKTRVKELDFREVKQRLDAGETLKLVDVREDNEWARGHLPGAIHLGKGVIERDIETAIPDKTLPLVLYCGGGFRSALAADNLQKMGYENVISMDGGWRSWSEAGFPTEKTE
jgi:rhodanese-related sulfurtransferase